MAERGQLLHFPRVATGAATTQDVSYSGARAVQSLRADGTTPEEVALLQESGSLTIEPGALAPSRQPANRLDVRLATQHLLSALRNQPFVPGVPHAAEHFLEALLAAGGAGAQAASEGFRQLCGEQASTCAFLRCLARVASARRTLTAEYVFSRAMSSRHAEVRSAAVEFVDLAEDEDLAAMLRPDQEEDADLRTFMEDVQADLLGDPA